MAGQQGFPELCFSCGIYSLGPGLVPLPAALSPHSFIKAKVSLSVHNITAPKKKCDSPFICDRTGEKLRRDSRARLHQNLHYLEGFCISEYLAGNPVSMVPFTTCPLSHPIHLYASNKIPFIRSCTALQSFQIFITWLFSFGKWTCSYSTLATTNHSLNKVSSDLIKPEETRSHTA